MTDNHQLEAVSRKSLSFLFALWEGGGNVPPTLAVIRRLLAAGHRVRLLGDPCQESDAQAVGVEFLPWTTAPKRLNKQADTDHVRDWEVKTPQAVIARLRDNLFFGPAERYANDVAAELKRAPVDCVVSSEMLFGPAIAAEAAGIPCVFLCANVYLFPRRGVPPFGPGFAPARNVIERYRDRFVNGMTTRIFGKGTQVYNEARRAFGLAPFAHPFEQLSQVERIVILTSESFDFSPQDPDPRIVYAGPELEDPIWSGEWTSPWEAGDIRPLVLVGLSSTFQDQTKLLRRIIGALAKLDVRGVVTTGPSIDPREMQNAPNVHICQSAPHARILRDASVMITHCGHGSVVRGLAANVPLLCIPMGRDQNDNAARVTHRGAGIRISMRSGEDEIARALTRLLAESSYREAAARLGMQLREDAARSSAVEHLVESAQCRLGSPRRNYGSREMSSIGRKAEESVHTDMLPETAHSVRTGGSPMLSL